MPYSSSQIVTPGYDPVLHRDFKGNHGDYVVFFVRKGNVVTVHESSFGGRGTVKEVIDLGQMVAKMRDLADEFGFTLDYTDDLPRGVSYPKSEYAGA